MKSSKNVLFVLLICIVMSIMLSACSGWYEKGQCYSNDDPTACAKAVCGGIGDDAERQKCIVEVKMQPDAPVIDVEHINPQASDVLEPNLINGVANHTTCVSTQKGLHWDWSAEQASEWCIANGNPVNP
jgi:hypothetical protein